MVVNRKKGFRPIINNNFLLHYNTFLLPLHWSGAKLNMFFKFIKWLPTTLTPNNNDMEEELVLDLINKELSYCGKTVDDIKDDPEWYFNNTMTQEQYDEWKDYCIKKISKSKRISKKMAEMSFSWIDLAYGLKVTI